MIFEELVTVKGEDRSALRKTVTLYAFEPDALEERKYLGIDRSTA